MGAAPAQAAPAEDALQRYHLADTWRNRPWQPAPGRFGRAADLSSTSEGVLFVLDDRIVAGRKAAVHVFDAAGRPLKRWLPPGQTDLVGGGPGRGWQPRRLDAAVDGSLLLLSHGGTQAGGLAHARIDHLDAEGALLARLELALPLPQAYVDIAAAPDGSVLLARRGANPWCLGAGGLPGRDGPGPSPYAVDRFAADFGAVAPPGGPLQPERILTPEELRVPLALDVDGEGRIHLAQRSPAACGGRDGDPPPRPPGWAPNDIVGPFAGLPSSVSRDGQEGAEGVLILSPEGAVEGSLAFAGPEDVAVGAAGIFVARHGELFAARADGSGFHESPLWSSPVGRAPSDLDDPPVHALDLSAGGRLLASLDDCLAQGVLWLDPPFAAAGSGSGGGPSPDPGRAAPRDARLIGGPDAPELEGPAWPLRLAADASPVVLQGRLRIGGRRPEPRYEASRLTGHDGQVVQRWSGAGSLRSQLGVCSGEGAWWARDVAVDDGVVYTLHADRLRRRSDDGFPDWTLWPSLDETDPDATPQLAAVDARDGRVLLLAQSGGELLWSDSEGTVRDRWPVGGRGPGSGEGALPLDVAIGVDRAYVALGGKGRVQVHGPDGSVQADWPTRDGVRAIAAARGGPETDDLFVLGRGGWVFRHRADGALAAAWPLPDHEVEATDIAVDDRGRVLVSWARLAPARDLLEQRSTPLRGSGIWVFEPDSTAVGPPPRHESAPLACTFVPDKRAAPATVPLGAEVSIELSLAGRCPDRPAPLELVLLLDASGSMASGEADARARDVAMTVLAGLDPRHVRVSLVRFDETARLVRPFGRDIAALAGELARVKPGGASHLASGLREVAALWPDAPATPEVRRVALLLTDGAVEEADALWPARDALRESGVALHAIVFANEAYDYRHRLTMRQLVVEEERLLSDPARPTLARWLFERVYHAPTRGLIEQLSVIDDLPADMAYVLDSARPPAVWDPVARRLRWQLAARPGRPPLGAPSLSYRVRPLQAGLRPTNLSASAELTDALGQPARLVFPVPEVEVRPPRHWAWLPSLSRGVCLRRPPPIDLVVVLDTSRSMEQSAGDPRDPSRTRLDAARAAVRLLAEGLHEQTKLADRSLGPLADPAVAHRLAVITFDGDARLAVPLVADPARVRLGLAGLATASGTRIDTGLLAAGELLALRERESRPVVLLLTDGRPDGGDAGAAAARRAAEGLEARRITLAFGSARAVDLPLLRALASRPADALHAPTVDRLDRLVADLAGRLACPGGLP